MEINYQKAILCFVATREHFFKNQKYYCYLFPTTLVMAQVIKSFYIQTTQQQSQPNPKYVIPLNLQTSIGWKVNPKVKSIIEILAFVFNHKGKSKEMVGNPLDLSQLKKLIRNQVTFSKIAEFYEPKYILGKGSSARVLLIKELISEQKYAAKSIDKAYLQKSENGIDAFYTEVKILQHLSQINSDSFLTLHEIFEGDHTFYLIIDLMEGKTLQEELDMLKIRKEKFPMGIVRSIMKQLLKGVQQMHENGIMHRDLKPDNLMFTSSNNYESLRIVDFGLATEINVEKYLFPKCGTPGYVAPEILNLQDRNLKYNCVSDMFSCGCIFYKLLSGSSLFQGTQFNEVLKLNKTCDYTLITPLLENVPEEAIALLQMMLQRQPEDRLTAEQALSSEFFTVSPKQNTTNFQDSLTPTGKLENLINFKNLKVQTKNIFQPDANDADGEENFSPFQKKAVQRNQLPKVEENHVNRIYSYIQLINQQQEYITSNEDCVEQEFHGEFKIQTFSLPKFKKPSFVPHQKNQCLMESVRLDTLKQFTPRQSLEGRLSIELKIPQRQGTIGSFYMKDPLSGMKKHKRQQSQIQQTTKQKLDSENGQMLRISLFDRRKFSNAAKNENENEDVF